MPTLKDTASFAEAKADLLAEAKRRGKSVEVLYLVIVKDKKSPRSRWKILSEAQYNNHHRGGYVAKAEWYSDEVGWRLYTSPRYVNE